MFVNLKRSGHVFACELNASQKQIFEKGGQYAIFL
jgi:hypothetical protein